MINKPTIIISSMGRTGTNFFARYFRKIFSDSVSLHEPGSIVLNRKKIRFKKSLKYAGWRVSVINKFINTEDIKKLSKKRMEGKINKEETAEKIIKIRKNIINNIDKNIYIESNYQFQGVLDVLPLVFSNFQSLYIIRDPRDWVRSFINRRGLYHWSDLHYILNNRINAYAVGEKTKTEWKQMNQFEKLSWAWNFINGYALDSIKKTATCRLIKFEDIFVADNKTNNLLAITDSLRQENRNLKINKNYKKITKTILEKKINKSYYSILPKWTAWENEQAKTLNKYCGKLMHKLGYGHEKEWQDLL
ncbi:MAG: hypothetical protein U9Q85_02455 [Patescibacteria group bacterium]|nr:hypothetical protein [Patescibacteria group bacterium]